MTNKINDPLSQKGTGSIAERVDEAIKPHSIRLFASKIDVSEGTLRRILKGEDPKLSVTVKIAEESGVLLNWLVTGEGPKHPGEDHKQVSLEPVVVRCDEFTEEFALIPGYHISASTGHGELNRGEQVKRHLAFRKKWLNFRGLLPDKLAVVFAHGDSMEPTIHSNNSLLVNTADTKLTDGSIFVLRFGDELYAKRLQKRFDGSIELISDNKEYSNQVVKADEVEGLHIIGKVVWIGKDLY
ncbi:helix-turn-helix transcriptional regulator [Shewanella insulae]|uniref:LexA family transcriptional regulator n=1 Tax=Shewanella insulae TaxID=2681496 RepID=UPI001EFD1333|nr:helix-turn-helix transcriptional regulator [Shewanella insulae]MCG9755001.1 helix-turn-helix transcriptional regulator [Shewanella insulae]